jgi:SSS family solute:Na+ symporter
VPVGLRGFIFAVLFGAIISAVDSLVNSTSTLLTLDVYKGLVRKSAPERSLVRFAQWAGLLLLIFGALWAPMVGRFGSIFAYAQDSWALMLAPVMALFLLAIFWRRMTAAAALAALLLAIPMLVLVYLRQFTGVLSGINIFNLSGIIFVISIILIMMISWLSRAPALENIRPLLWQMGLIALPVAETKDGYPWRKRVSFWFGAVAAVFIIIYIIFW